MKIDKKVRRILILVFFIFSAYSAEKAPPEMQKCNGCGSFSFNDIENPAESNPSIYVFISFSVPEKTWMELDGFKGNRDKKFILRGLPNNSFRDFSEKIMALKKRGLVSTVQIDPKLFQKFNIQKVPAFVLIEGDKFDKVTGNISLTSAMEIFKRNGEILHKAKASKGDGG